MANLRNRLPRITQNTLNTLNTRMTRVCDRTLKAVTIYDKKHSNNRQEIIDVCGVDLVVRRSAAFRPIRAFPRHPR